MVLSVAFSACNSENYSAISENHELDSIAALYHSGNLDSCIMLALAFKEKNCENDKVLHLLSSAYLKMKNDSLAELFARKALEINEENHIALLNLGILLDKKGQSEAAVVYYEKSILADSTFVQTFSNFAGNRLLAGDFESAVTYGEKAVKLGGKIEDEGILCVSYHKNKDYFKRDSLYNLLESRGYKQLTAVNELIYR